MSTQFNFNLSTALKNALETNGSGNGVYAYAFAFGTPDSGPDAGVKGSLMRQVTLVNNGVAASDPNFSIGSFPSGQVIVVIQQGGDGSLPSHIAAGVTGSPSNKLGVITPADAQTHNYSYQVFEASLENTTNDLGDISALNTFGFGATMEVVFQDGTSDHRGFLSKANDIFTAVGSNAVEPFNPNIFPATTGPNRLGIGPASITGDFPSSDWKTYVDNLASNSTVLNDIRIVAAFTGSSIQANPQLSVYGVEYDTPTSSFWLVPDVAHGGTNTDWIRIPKETLKANIYVQPTDLEIHQGSKTGPIVDTTNLGFTPNNASGAVSRDFVAGFDAGYWGGKGTSPNPLVATEIDLNHQNNWNVNYAYDGSLNPGLVTVSNVLGSGPGTQGGDNRFYDPWAQAIQSHGNAYGWSYSDLVSAGGINPQITLWDTTVTNGQQVPTINIKLYDNGETPPTGSFLTAPDVYVAPPSGGYHPSLTPAPKPPSPFGYINTIGFNFNFGVSNLSFAPYLDTPITFKFYVGHNSGSSQADADGFIPLSVTAPNGDWYNYNVVNSGGVWSLSPTTEHTTAGSFSLYDLPTTADGTTSWYQLEFGVSGHQTLYNLYAQSGTAQGVTHAITDLVVDRAVQVTTTPATSNTVDIWSLNFAPGGSPTYEIDNIAGRAKHDINADGLSDLVFQNTNGTVFAWEQNGSSTIAAGQIGTPDPAWQAKAIADFYGDGGSDILFQNSSSSDVFVWKQDGFSTPTASSIGTPGLQWQIKGAGDINGDGAADIVFQNSNTGEVFAWEQHGFSTIANGAGTIGTPGTVWQVKGVADFSSDGKADILFQNSSTGDVAIWNLNGLTISSVSVVGSPGTAWQTKGTGDVNGDGYADIVFQNASTGDVAIWEMTTFTAGTPAVTYDKILASGIVGTPGTVWQVAGTGSFSGNGQSDIVFQNTSTGEVYEWQMNGLQINNATSLGHPGTDWHIV